ncbi:MAG: hypothetical protein LAO51_09990 [Acidobacteriia bacterium]|nr:hypothetical protein [Terriglobia bacterium]
MEFLRRCSDYTVTVDGTFLDHRRWLICGMVELRADLDPDARQRAGQTARFDLMYGFVLQAERGYRLGARRIHAVIEGDDEVAGLFDVLHAERDPRQAA